jgi:hypothetical protein
VYCAVLSHACYEAPGSTSNDVGDVIASDGVKWDPRAGRLRLHDATAQPWYGFGGAWGDPDLDWGVSVEIGSRDLTGPLGPGPAKETIPAAWRRLRPQKRGTRLSRGRAS